MLSLFIVAQDSKAVGVLEPNSYALKRFEEVILNAQAEESDDLQERLIELRAKLLLAERDLSLMERESEDQGTEPPKPFLKKAARAKVDHFQQLLKDAEAKTLAQRKKKKR